MKELNITKFVNSWKFNLKTVILNKKLNTKLAVLQVDNSLQEHTSPSDVYIKNIKKDCNEFGFEFELYKYKSYSDAFVKLCELNIDPKIKGIFVTYPLPGSGYYVKIYINEDKDLDNISGRSRDVYSCTASGIFSLLDHYDMIENKNIVIINRSNIVGKPLADMLTDQNANITILHSKTSKDKLKQFLDTSDVIITATGHPNTITPDMLDIKNKEYHIIDAGLFIDEQNKRYGDVNPDVFKNDNIKGWCTPVNNGVGLLTRCALMENMYTLSTRH